MASATFDTLAALTNELATQHDLQHAIDALKFDLLKWIIGIALAQIGLLIWILLKVP